MLTLSPVKQLLHSQRLVRLLVALVTAFIAFQVTEQNYYEYADSKNNQLFKETVIGCLFVEFFYYFFSYGENIRLRHFGKIGPQLVENTTINVHHITKVCSKAKKSVFVFFQNFS